MHLVVQRVVLKFFPTMASNAVFSIRTALGVKLQELCFVPISALKRLDVPFIGVSSQILPVMSIHTSVSIVLDVAKRAQLCFV